MNIKIQDKFCEMWDKYFYSANLPIVFFYSNESQGEIINSKAAHRCIISDIIKAQNGKTICIDNESILCGGGKRYVGFTNGVRPNFEYFLSCGIPGKMEGERYKKSPELVKKIMGKWPVFKAPSKYIIFKRWDKILETDNPDVVIFFAEPDVLSGLFTLSGYDIEDPYHNAAPFSAGCGSIIQYPYLEINSKEPKSFIGMFDVSARPYVKSNILSFSLPMKRFEVLINNMDESFLITSSWEKISKRIRSKQ